MIRNFFITSVRNFTKHKFFTFINITGLSVGMASCMLILTFVLHEQSYDRFHTNYENIYRICARGVIGDTKINQVYTTAKLPETLIMAYGEVVNAVRIMEMRDQKIQVGEERFSESNVVAADSTFFDIFSFPVVKGNAKRVLNEPQTMVISATTAKKYFGDKDPLNKVVRLFGDTDFKVTGVMKDMPDNSHFHFNVLLSVVSFERRLDDHWWNNNFKTYLVLNDGADPGELESKFPAFIKKHVGEGKDDWDEWLASGNNWEYFLQPLASIHLNSDLNGEFETNGNINYIYIFMTAAILIVIIASVNFMNLSTAKSEKRAREVGLRKVIGSNRLQLVMQFLLEAVFMSMFAFALSVLLAVLALPWFNSFTGKEFTFLDIYNWQTMPVLALCVLLLGLLSGIYPAFYLSSFQPLQVMKAKIGSGRNYFNLRGLLVVGQFVISTFLILGTLVVYRQLYYLQHVNLGFEKEQIILLEGAEALAGKYEYFKEQLMANAGIRDVSISWSVPGRSFMNWGCSAEGREGWTTLNVNLTDVDFLKTYGMNMAVGRYFSRDFPSDSLAVVINENAQALLGWEDPLQRKIKMNNYELHVIGVIKDFHYESLHTEVRPMGLIMLPETWSPNYISIRVSGSDVPGTVNFVKSVWDDATGNYPYQYSFFDQEYQQLYKNEIQTSNLFVFFAIIAIFIACLGLFALSAFVAEKRTKEIGIRKVNGAGINAIIYLLSYSFTKWVLIACVVSLPVGFLVMQKWLQNFAYKAAISWWIFIASAVLALLIAMLTVSFQSIKAAIKNPVDALRYE